LELGIDLLFDKHHKAWLLEVNSRPSGRLIALTQRDPQRYGPLAEEAVLRPLRALASLA
jgi:glutathione synthase/RimK-type ligase-like ATP-grasp enzyme